MATQSAVPAIGEPVLRKRESLWGDAFRRLIRNRGAVTGGILILILMLVYIFADVIAVKPFDVQVNADNNKVPQWIVTVFPMTKGYARISNAYPLGADDLGRDLFSRIVYGTRVSLTVAFVGPIISLLIGVAYGCLAGYWGGRADDLMMRFVDVMYAFPALLLIILMMAFFRSSFAKAAEPGTFKYTMNALDTQAGGMLFIFIGIGVTSWEAWRGWRAGRCSACAKKSLSRRRARWAPATCGSCSATSCLTSSAR